MSEISNKQENSQSEQNQDSKLPAEKTPRLLKRRTLLKGLFFGAAAAMLPKISFGQESPQLPAEEVAVPEGTIPAEAPVAPETETWKKRQFIMDFAPAFEQDVIDFDHHTPADIIAEYPSDTSQWAQELVVRADMNWDSLPEDLKQTLIEAIGMFDKKYSRHAIDVTDAATNTLELTLGIEKSQYDIYPLQRTARLANPNYQDSLNNKGIQIEFSADDMIAAAQQRDESVINISSQPGLLTFTKEQFVKAVPQELLDANHVYPIMVEGQQRYIIAPLTHWTYDVIQNKPQTKTGPDGSIKSTATNVHYIDKVIENGQEKWIQVDTGQEVQLLTQDQVRDFQNELFANNTHVVERSNAELDWEAPYVNEQAVRNFKEALRTARECPNQLWVYSAGNEREEIGQLKAQVVADGEEIPENILFVAQLNKFQFNEAGKLMPPLPTHKVWGADIYVINEDFNVEKDGSSFSAPIVSSIAEALAEQGLGPVEIKNKILEFCETYETIGSKQMKYYNEDGVYYQDVPTYKTELIPVLDRQKVMFELNRQEWANQFGRG